MPKLGRKTPCAECPWRRNSLRGWLGEDNPEDFYRANITNEGAMPCHMQIDYEDPHWKETQLPDADLCAGSLIYFNNTNKRPRDPEIAQAVDAVGTSPQVFEWPDQFIGHHMPKATPEKVREVTAKALWPYPQE